MSYIGSTPTTQSFIAGTDYFNGTGSATAFTLSRSVVSVNDIQATVNNVVQVPNDAYTVSGTTITFTSAPSAGTNNIYVRYLSTTTQSITPSQNTVSYSTLNSDNQSKLGISFKNRIINGAMMIDQRGPGTYTPNNTYTLDRWQFQNSQTAKVTIAQNQGSVTPPTGYINYLGMTSSSAYSVTSTDYFMLAQKIEGLNIADLNWGTSTARTVTLSALVYSSLTGTFGGSLVNQSGTRSYPFTYTISAANTWTQISVTIPGDTSGTWLTTNGIGINIYFSVGAGSTVIGTAGAWASAAYYGATGQTSVVGTSGATLYITGVQLEVGTQATTFDYRSYGTELNLCYRYFQKYLGTSAFEMLPCIFIAYSTSAAEGPFVYKQTMRTAPTLTTSSLQFTDGSANYTGTFSIDQVGLDTTRLSCTGSSGLTSFRAYYPRAANSTSAYLYLSAEL